MIRKQESLTDWWNIPIDSRFLFEGGRGDRISTALMPKDRRPLKRAFSQNSLGAYRKQLKSDVNHYGVNLSSRVSIVC